MKKIDDVIFTEKAKKMKDCFLAKVDEIRKNNKDYFEENGIDFDKSFILEFSNHGSQFKIIDEKVAEKFGEQFSKKYQECISKIFENKNSND
ncbi:hypothetical protein [Tenacibaculum singaporense]|uniref:Uncharacterized protein n=1 Tax=Tenacibaculum singaporense TaxID=2358479 RepID=A0A3S8R5R9_9FLAO|nr:hypothetical protein [Tenacibaculum singaporense]AZJ35109.1 hypothetical protein D6T69_06070 [Tenacibaculum singaporense]